jgi:hypothetical protein
MNTEGATPEELTASSRGVHHRSMLPGTAGVQAVLAKSLVSGLDIHGGAVMTLLEELGHLSRSMPGPSASASEIAHWYERKAHMLEHIAAEGGAGRQAALRQAEAAHRHATELLLAA